MFAFDGGEETELKSGVRREEGALDGGTGDWEEELAGASVVLEGEEWEEEEDSLSSLAGDTVGWLAARLGPVLASRHLAGPLLRLLSCCYTGREGLQAAAGLPWDQQVRVSTAQCGGDLAAAPVLTCLARLVALYGEALVLSQYLPYCQDLAARPAGRVGTRLEAGLLAAIALLHASLPLLSDSVLMREAEGVVGAVLLPVLNTVTTSSNTFARGGRARHLLLYKLLDCVYLLGLRLGEEEARTRLSQWATTLLGAWAPGRGEGPGAGQVTEALSPVLACQAWLACSQLLGGPWLQARLLGRHHQLPCPGPGPLHRPLSWRELAGGHGEEPVGGSRQSGAGNRILVGGAGPPPALQLVSRVPPDSGRQLKGNWLAYWEHEAGRHPRHQRLDLKQIRLQSCAGHTGAVRTLAVLDNENSFLSGGRDRAVRLWAVRSCGEGEAVQAAQACYSHHRRSLLSVCYLAGPGSAASCDAAALALWDPFTQATLQVSCESHIRCGLF